MLVLLRLPSFLKLSSDTGRLRGCKPSCFRFPLAMLLRHHCDPLTSSIPSSFETEELLIAMLKFRQTKTTNNSAIANSFLRTAYFGSTFGLASYCITRLLFSHEECGCYLITLSGLHIICVCRIPVHCMFFVVVRQQEYFNRQSPLALLSQFSALPPSACGPHFVFGRLPPGLPESLSEV